MCLLIIIMPLYSNNLSKVHIWLLEKTDIPFLLKNTLYKYTECPYVSTKKNHLIYIPLVIMSCEFAVKYGLFAFRVSTHAYREVIL